MGDRTIFFPTKYNWLNKGSRQAIRFTKYHYLIGVCEQKQPVRYHL